MLHCVTHYVKCDYDYDKDDVHKDDDNGGDDDVSLVKCIFMY